MKQLGEERICRGDDTGENVTKGGIRVVVEGCMWEVLEGVEGVIYETDGLFDGTWKLCFHVETFKMTLKLTL